jgi:hypothetical protein
MDAVRQKILSAWSTNYGFILVNLVATSQISHKMLKERVEYYCWCSLKSLPHDPYVWVNYP